MESEYRPRCGWLAYARRRKAVETIKSTLFALAFVTAYGMLCAFCETL